MYPRLRDYPKTLRVGDATYSIHFLTQKEIDRISSTKGNRGLCSQGDEAIYIVRGLDRRTRFETFAHEVIHALEFEYSLPIAHRLVYLLEMPVTRLMLDNWLSSDWRANTRGRTA